MDRWRAHALIAIVLVASACRGAPTGTLATAAPGTSSADSTTLPGGIALAELKVSVSEASYGSLTATTTAGATCSGLLRVDAGHFGEEPPGTLASIIASTAGVAHWTYPTPRVPSGTATYSVTCATPAERGTATGSFEISGSQPLKASSFKIHVSTEAPAHATYDPDPSLVPLRDAAVAKMKATLAGEWRSATRGLGGLQVVDASADITMYVVAAHGTSVHRSSDDGSQDMVVYVSDTFGPQTVENVVATALHEIGHMWCCYGDGTSEGHWITKTRDPGLYGVDKYGLMTDPVTCEIFGTVVSCPNRFSDREMSALGFASFPPPVVDACVQQALVLKGSIASINTQLDTLGRQLDAQQASLASLKQQLQAIEAKYPGGIPPAAVGQYNALVDQYNTIATQNRATVATYNDLIAQGHAQTTQINSLPCDPS